jgi:hypothetical protein
MKCQKVNRILLKTVKKASPRHNPFSDASRLFPISRYDDVEVRVSTEDNQTLRSPALPNLCVGGCQQIAIKKMFGFVPLRSQPNT